MKSKDKSFYSGIITALAIMNQHGDEVQFDELVNTCDLDDLVRVAVENDELEFSGLAKREYAQKSVQRIGGYGCEGYTPTMENGKCSACGKNAHR